MKITKKRLEEMVNDLLASLGDNISDSELVNLLKDKFNFTWKELAYFDIHDEFPISIYMVEDFTYNEYREELNFYDRNGFLVSSINYANKDYLKLLNKPDAYVWNYLSNLFGEPEIV